MNASSWPGMEAQHNSDAHNINSSSRKQSSQHSRRIVSSAGDRRVGQAGRIGRPLSVRSNKSSAHPRRNEQVSREFYVALCIIAIANTTDLVK